MLSNFILNPRRSQVSHSVQGKSCDSVALRSYSIEIFANLSASCGNRCLRKQTIVATARRSTKSGTHLPSSKEKTFPDRVRNNNAMDARARAAGIASWRCAITARRVLINSRSELIDSHIKRNGIEVSEGRHAAAPCHL